ncbi:Alpha/Beta hydrolase protein [Lineolata rhizophorae]|uniref:Alpha/Beta hydrolase protein n=1 Tax=Lineolata rhizophorae TaxID=578093 RepID=A0A6A6P6N5_9PEZI|nr:Alpha/Beta hydrolase protein [Lineolata rhizophorae]
MSIQNVIEKEALEVPLDYIILAGISQGCATAIYTLLGGNIQLGGFIGLSGWLPRGIEAVERMEVNEEALKTPVFLFHSKDDEVVPAAYGELLREGLDQLRMVVEWHSYEDGRHWVNEPKGVNDMTAFITKATQG